MLVDLNETRPEPICGMDTWVPVPARIVDVKSENANTRTFSIEFEDPVLRSMYRFEPGQFNMLYAPGVGEAAISISSDSDHPERLDHTIRVVGSVTRAIERIGKGGVIGVRGPFGRGWPIAALEGLDVVIVTGGIGLAPLRPVIYSLLKNRHLYRRVVVLFGCRSPEDQLFADELKYWDADGNIQVLVTVDHGSEGWVGPVGVVTDLLKRVKLQANNTAVLVCGPKILNRVAAWNFLQLHVPPERVFVSLERNMNCGFGRCGHCQLGGKFICKDGPVFALSDIGDMLTREEI